MIESETFVHRKTLYEMPEDKMTAGLISLHKVTVHKKLQTERLSVHETPVDRMTTYEMPKDKMTVYQMPEDKMSVHE